jgi:hypothetical protein
MARSLCSARQSEAARFPPQLKVLPTVFHTAGQPELVNLFMAAV